MDKINTLNHYLLRNEYASKFWCVLFLVYLLISLICIWRLAGSLSEGILFAVIDDGTFYLTKSLEFDQLAEEHEDQARLAAETFFERNALGRLENEARLERLFLGEARDKAIRMVLEDNEYLYTRKMYQNLKINDTKILKMRDHSVRVQVIGELRRVGEFNGEFVAESMSVEARFHFVLNKDMLYNGKYPTVVKDFNYEVEPLVQL